MALKMPAPLAQWSVPFQARVNQTLEANDITNRKKGTDVEIEAGVRLILRSPDGTKYQVSVTDAGVIESVPL